MAAQGVLQEDLSRQEKKNMFTHYLFMDDDILIDPDSINRTMSFLSFANNDYAFSGAMLCMDRKNTIWESGANYTTSPKTLSPEPCFFDINLSVDLLNQISNPYEFEYGGWWYFCYSEKAVELVGLPMPFFIRGDDVEYSLRLKKNGIKNINLPGVGVWHETFYSKSSSWLEYYNFRNYFILSLIHSSTKSFIKTYFKVVYSIISDCLCYNYNKASIHLRSLNDVLLGAIDLSRYSSPDFQKYNIQISKSLTDELISPVSNLSILEKGSFLRILLKFLTLNYHLWGKNKNLVKLDNINWKKNVLFTNISRSDYVITNIKSLQTVRYSKSFVQFISVFLKSILYLGLTFFSLPILKIRYSKQQKNFSNTVYWKKFLKLS
jgi:galactofuranosylgalactofuranosylrhamnosyl-N-acetylglucosaminyl-diphospho-decaprenol beta-1,5/1,6-galactofuranosyltransferase